jgi:hypothetical protein
MSRLNGPPLVWCPLLALLSSSVLASCTSGDGQPSVDECADDYQYVIDRVRLPQDRADNVLPLFGLDEDPTNGLGALLETLHLLAPSLDAQAAADAALAEGEAVTLLNIRARSLETATAVGSWFFDGGEPTVAPCDSQGEECGRHFAPGTEFTRPDTMDDVELDRMIVGQIVGGTLHAGLGAASVELAFMPGVPRLVLTLEPGTAWATGLSPMRGEQWILFGAIRAEQLSETFIPYLRDSLNQIIATGCDASAGCACNDDLAGELVAALDVTDSDCHITVEELLAGPLASNLAPHIDLFDEDGGYNPGLDGVNDAWALGVELGAVSASFRSPPRPRCSLAAE